MQSDLQSIKKTKPKESAIKIKLNLTGAPAVSINYKLAAFLFCLFGNISQDANGGQRNHQGRTAIANKRQGQTGHGHQTDHGTDINQSLEDKPKNNANDQ